MRFKKPKFWDLKKSNIISILLLPFTLPIILNNLILKFKFNKENRKIKSICVGNIYLGGTGKTPLVIKIYDILNKLGNKVATVKKNYSNQKDEQILLSEKTSLILSKSRKDAIQQGIDQNLDVLIFDDGLQTIGIEFDIKLVCFKIKNWIGNGQLIPAGPMREKISSLKRFDAVILNGNSSNFEEIRNQIQNINPDIHIFRTYYKIKDIKNYDLNSKYLIFSGLGNPSDFKDILLENKFNIVKEMVFPDHYKYSFDDLEKILNYANNQNLKILTTEKDYTKIPDEFRKYIKILAIDLIIENDNKFIELINN